MTNIRLLPAVENDCHDLFVWRNEATTRQNSKTADPIEWRTHVSWFEAAIRSSAYKILIGYRNSDKVGSVRFDQMSPGYDRCLVSIMIAPSHRGQGFGKHLLSAAITEMPSVTIDAEIAINNHLSRRIFTQCGFTLLPEQVGGRFERYRRLPSDPDGAAHRA